MGARAWLSAMQGARSPYAAALPYPCAGPCPAFFTHTPCACPRPCFLMPPQESMRLMPTGAEGYSRCFPQDIQLGGYTIPADTWIWQVGGGTSLALACFSQGLRPRSRGAALGCCWGRGYACAARREGRAPEGGPGALPFWAATQSVQPSWRKDKQHLQHCRWPWHAECM